MFYTIMQQQKISETKTYSRNNKNVDLVFAFISLQSWYTAGRYHREGKAPTAAAVPASTSAVYQWQHMHPLHFFIIHKVTLPQLLLMLEHYDDGGDVGSGGVGHGNPSYSIIYTQRFSTMGTCCFCCCYCC